VSESVVSVGILALDGNAPESGADKRAMGASVNGSGFVVSREGYVITALHVVRATQRLGEELRGSDNRLYVGIRGGSSFSPLPAEVVDSDAAHDLALLKVKSVARVPAVRFSSAPPDDGALVEAAGLPGMAGAALVTNTGHVVDASQVRLGRRVVKGMSESEASQLAPLRDFYFADMKTDEGMSGGPIYLVDGMAIIGVVHGYIQDPPLAVFIPARYVLELMRRNNVRYSAAETDSH
jgi:S1-C subfamily serine protease